MNTTESSLEKNRSGKQKISSKRGTKDALGGKQTSLVGILPLDERLATELEDKDSCDLADDDVMEGMIGDNFNTFGEHASDVFYKQRKSLEDD